MWNITPKSKAYFTCRQCQLVNYIEYMNKDPRTLFQISHGYRYKPVSSQLASCIFYSDQDRDVMKNTYGIVINEQHLDDVEMLRHYIRENLKSSPILVEMDAYDCPWNKGYHLLQTPDILSVSEIESRLTTDHMARKLYYYDVTDSTNTDCKRYMEEEGVHGTLVVADMQRAGKGRRGRSWESPSGHAIFMSLGLKPEISPNKASMLTLVMALAVCDGIAGVTGQETGIKWPNDVVLHQKKICGILTEMSAEPDYINHVIIGVGINVNQTEFPEEIAKTATSLCIEMGQAVQRASVIAAVMSYFENYYEKFIQAGDLSAILEEYNDRLVNRNAQVRVLDPKGEFSGTALGINKSGELLVKKEDGSVAEVYAGEVSVRGIYGYV